MSSAEQTSSKTQQIDTQNKSKQLGNYMLQKTLGVGAFGKVKLAIHILTGEYVAIKILEKKKIQDVTDVERVQRELHILKMIRHPSLIQLYEYYLTLSLQFEFTFEGYFLQNVKE